MKTLFGWSTFDFNKEFAAARTVAQRLEGDFVTRVMASLLTAGMIAWSGLYIIALVWLICIAANEAIEPSVVRRLLKRDAASPRALILYTCHLASGSAIWAGAGGRPLDDA
ncbi:MAG: hypothetical protein AAF767_10815 [Pseudomonadota bacterium]